MESPILYADRGCPFGHRVLALLDHVGATFERVEAPLGELPAGLERWSPSGRIPLLVHGSLVIGETFVMLEHLAEAHGFEAAYPVALGDRTMHRHAMALVDLYVAPILTGRSSGETRLVECIDVLDSTCRRSSPGPSLLAFHLAPIWMRLGWWLPETLATRQIRERRALASWLDATTRLEAVAKTAPSRQDSIADFRAVCADRGRDSA